MTSYLCVACDSYIKFLSDYRGWRQFALPEAITMQQFLMMKWNILVLFNESRLNSHSVIKLISHVHRHIHIVERQMLCYVSNEYISQQSNNF